MQAEDEDCKLSRPPGSLGDGWASELSKGAKGGKGGKHQRTVPCAFFNLDRGGLKGDAARICILPPKVARARERIMAKPRRAATKTQRQRRFNLKQRQQQRRKQKQRSKPKQQGTQRLEKRQRSP